MEQFIEDREETCSAASKLVKIKLTRLRRKGDSPQTGEIVDFQCNSQSSNCESRCTYRMLMEDY